MNLLNPMGRSANPEETIFAAALERKSPAERAAYLDGACAGNPELRGSVEKLLRASEAAGTFLDQSPIAGGCPSGEAESTVREGANRLTRPDEEGPGTQIGRYKLLEKIGEGGFFASLTFFASSFSSAVVDASFKILSSAVSSNSEASSATNSVLLHRRLPS